MIIDSVDKLLWSRDVSKISTENATSRNVALPNSDINVSRCNLHTADGGSKATGAPSPNLRIKSANLQSGQLLRKQSLN